MQDAASAAVDGLLIDVDYHFYNGEKVDFGGKVLTIECKAKFIGDGNLIFTKLGKGSALPGFLWKALQHHGLSSLGRMTISG